MVLAMGWFKGLSTDNSYASGLASFNLVDGDVSVTINGLSKDEGWDVWMVDSAAGQSIALESDDKMQHLGSLKHEGKAASLVAHLGKDAFATFDMDLIIVTKAGKNPIENRTLIGTTSLFHHVYRSKQRVSTACWLMQIRFRPSLTSEGLCSGSSMQSARLHRHRLVQFPIRQRRCSNPSPWTAEFL